MEHHSPTYVGPLEPFEFCISAEIQTQYLEALEDYHSRYLGWPENAGPIVHPGILLNQSNATRSPSFGGPNTHWIHVRERTRFTSPARLDDNLVVRWCVEEHEPWFGRALTRVACVLTRRDGGTLMERTSWGFRTCAERPIAATEERPPAQPPAEPGPQRRDAPGDGIRGRPKLVTGERIRLFSGPTTHNLHTDDQVARDAGLPAPVASATQGMGYLCEFMIDNLGEQWLSGGRWQLSFRQPIFPGDQVSVFGRVTRPGGDRYTVDLRRPGWRPAPSRQPVYQRDHTQTCAAARAVTPGRRDLFRDSRKFTGWPRPQQPKVPAALYYRNSRAERKPEYASQAGG